MDINLWQFVNKKYSSYSYYLKIKNPRILASECMNVILIIYRVATAIISISFGNKNFNKNIFFGF